MHGEYLRLHDMFIKLQRDSQWFYHGTLLHDGCLNGKGGAWPNILECLLKKNSQLPSNHRQLWPIDRSIDVD